MLRLSKRGGGGERGGDGRVKSACEVEKESGNLSVRLEGDQRSRVNSPLKLIEQACDMTSAAPTPGPSHPR